jgi:hypothetical protein
MKKKWYDLFVVTDRPDEASGASTAPAPKADAKRAGDLVPEASEEPAFTEPVADPGVFAEIYAAAQIAEPPHGYTILKVAEMLASEHLHDLPANVKQKSILVALDAAGVSIEHMVEDAVRRDRALDTYEKVLERSLGELRAACDAENRTLEAEIERQVAQLKARVDENKQRVLKEESSLATWRERKRAEESRIAEAVRYFVSENPITQGGDHVRQDR